MSAMSDFKYDPPVTVKAGQIQFVEACHPPLIAGAYKVTMSQAIKESKEALVPWNSDPYASELVFWVDAPRFSLNPTDIHSVYPPSNQIGGFDNALPHVVFTRRTLPWERALDGMPPRLGQPFAPWIGLLLVQEEELLIGANGRTTNHKREVKSLPLISSDQDSLLLATAKNTLVPDLGQHGYGAGSNPDTKLRAHRWEKEKWRYEKGETSEQREESCLAVDLPGELFKAIAPRLDDLPYLAHARQIDTGDKEVQALNDKGWFSLVICNRVPKANKDHRVFVVSLEGHQDRLHEKWTPASGEEVRLAVLASWSFKCAGANDFKACMKELKIDSLHLPFEPFDDKSSAAKDIVNAGYARGYTAFNHAMRHGEKTVSWYRGPLVPLNYDKPQQIQHPVSCADELLRYDPTSGLFDVSYAAAWQLGRLLALQNHGFALALNRTRKALRTEAERQMRIAEIKDLTGGKDFIEDDLMDQVANSLGDKLSKAMGVPK